MGEQLNDHHSWPALEYTGIWFGAQLFYAYPNWTSADLAAFLSSTELPVTQDDIVTYSSYVEQGFELCKLSPYKVISKLEQLRKW